MKRFIAILFVLSIFIYTNAYAGLNLDVSYWRISNAKSSFDEKISEGGTRGDLGGLNIQTADVETGRTVWEIETDPSKYLFDLFYEFDENFHRLTIGFQYAGTGNDDVKEVSWIDQEKDLRDVLIKPESSSGKITYTNFYSAYRIFPLQANISSDNNVKGNGFDVMFNYIELKQDYTVKKASYTTSSKSLGLGMQGEQTLRNSSFSIKGHIVYLPFFDYNGNGWDAQLKLRYNFSDYLTFYIGGKWFDLDIDAEETITNIAQIPGFSSSEATFKGLNTKLSGYTIGLSYWF